MSRENNFKCTFMHEFCADFGAEAGDGPANDRFSGSGDTGAGDLSGACTAGATGAEDLTGAGVTGAEAGAKGMCKAGGA